MSWQLDENGERVLDGEGNRIPLADTSVPKKSSVNRLRDIRISKLAPYEDSIQKHAKTYGLDPNVIKAMLLVEADKNVSPLSTNNKTTASGLGQITKATAKHLGVKDVFNPDQNIEGVAKYISENYDNFNGDLEKTVVAYHDGPGSMRKYQKALGTDWKNGISTEGKEHLSRYQDFLETLKGGGQLANRPPKAVYSLDTRDLAGLPPLAYPQRDANDPANVLFNDPAAQQANVDEAQRSAIQTESLRNQMGSGVGAFAYKLPGMGKLSELTGLAPKGSAVNKVDEIAQYNKLRTGGQMAGEMIPDVVLSSLAGGGASQALKVGRLGTHLGRAAEGLVAGGVSAGIHQAQNVGSGEKFNPTQALVETLASGAMGPTVGGMGDILKAAAPRLLRKVTGVASANSNEPFKTALEENLVPTLGGFKGTANKTSKVMNSLDQTISSEALNASQRPVIPKVNAPQVPGAAKPKVRPQYQQPTSPVGPTPVVKPAAPADPVPPQAPAPVMAPPRATPGQFPVAPEEQAARVTAAREADRVKRLAEAAARRTAPPPVPKPVPKPIPPTPEVKAPTLAEKQATLRAKPEASVVPKAKPKYTKEDQALISDATDAEKALAVQKKLKGQRGSIDMSWLGPKKEIPQSTREAWNNLTLKEKLSTLTRAQVSKMNEGLPPILGGKAEPKGLFGSQKGAIPNPFLRDIDKTHPIKAYHGNAFPSENFSARRGRASGHFFSEDPKVAAQYAEFSSGNHEYNDYVNNDFFGNHTTPVRLPKHDMEIDLNGASAHSEEFDAAVRKAMQLAKEGKVKVVRFKNVLDAGDGKEAVSDQLWVAPGAEQEIRNPWSGQRGAILNPFARKPTPSAVQMTESRKIPFKLGPLHEARTKLAAEMSNPITKSMTDDAYDRVIRTLDKWEAVGHGRPTTRGGKQSQMTVQDAMGLADVIEKSITKGNTGENKASKMLLEEVRKTIAEKAPKVGAAVAKKEKVGAFKDIIDKKVQKDANKLGIPAGVQLATLAGGSLAGAIGAEKGKRISGGLTGAALGLTLSKLATSPGGLKLMYKMGKGLANKGPVKRVISQTARTTYAKSKEKK